MPISFDAFNNAEIFLTQPLQVIVGSDAGYRWMREEIVNRAAAKTRNLHIVEGGTCMRLHDRPAHVDPSPVF